MIKYCLILMVPLAALSGCSDSYRITVKCVTKGQTRVSQNARIVVMVDQNAVNQILEKEVKTRIEKVLRDSNYQVVGNLTDADYRLAFQISLDSYQETSEQPTGSHRHGIGNYVQHVQTVWEQKLDIKLYRAEMVIWEGQSIISERYPEEEKNINYLITAVFEYFGQDSGGRKIISIKVNDPRVLAIK